MTIAERSVAFVEPMPGFDDDIEFSLSPIDPSGKLMSLRSVRNPGLRFVVTPAAVFFAEYQDTVGAALTAPLAEALGGRGDADPEQSRDDAIELFIVLTIGASLADTTANLRAPIAVNGRNGRAVQVILDDVGLPMWQPLLAAA